MSLLAALASQPGRLSGCVAKLNHANQHIGFLEAALDRERPPLELTLDQDLDSAKGLLRVEVRVAEVPEFPERWSLLIGDAVQNLRAALDYLAYELVRLETGAYDEHTQFPIATSPDKQTHTKTIELLGPHWQIIEEYQPYGDPNQVTEAAFELLREFSNQDKHRLLVPVSAAADLNNMMLVIPGNAVSRRDRAWFHTGEVKVGTVLAREEFVVLGDRPQVHLTPLYSPYVAFREMPTLMAHNTLLAIHRKAESLMQRFVPLFLGLTR